MNWQHRSFVFQMTQLRLRGGPPSSKWQSWDSNPRKHHQAPYNPSLDTTLSSHSILTSSGSESLNSQPSPVQLMKDWQDLSVSNSRRNCHSWIGPLPGDTSHGESLHKMRHTLSSESHYRALPSQPTSQGTKRATQSTGVAGACGTDRKGEEFPPGPPLWWSINCLI